MRLVCPNCEAKYEVPEDAIPETGRDVQCANCGHAWYQMRSRPAAPEPVAAAPVAAAPATLDEPVVAAAAEAAGTDPEPPVVEVPEAPPVEDPAVADPPAEDAPAEDVPAEDEPAEDVPLEDPPEVEMLETAAVASEPEFEPAPVEVSLDEASVSEVPSDPETVVEVVAEEVLSAAGADPVEVAADVVADPVAPEVIAADAAAPLAETAAEVAAAFQPTVETEIDAADDGDDVDEAADASDMPLSAAKPVAYAVDDSVLAILREEAEREAQARRGELRPLETQTDLGIEAAMASSRKPVEVASAAISAASSVDHGDDGRPSARRDLLPDVEEINSTLRPSEQSADGGLGADGMLAAEGRSGFRSGFLLVMTLTILAAALYLSADMLSELVPALAGPLDAFTGFVDSLRLRIDGLMQTATVAINGDGG